MGKTAAIPAYGSCQDGAERWTPSDSRRNGTGQDGGGAGSGAFLERGMASAGDLSFGGQVELAQRNTQVLRRRQYAQRRCVDIREGHRSWV